jgi:hypothetical protein
LSRHLAQPAAVAAGAAAAAEPAADAVDVDQQLALAPPTTTDMTTVFPSVRCCVKEGRNDA